MDRYLIETPHRAEDCVHLLQLVNATGYLTHFDWGCMSGVHTGWAIIEAGSEAEARLVVPPLVRKEARVVKVTKFEAADVMRLHQG